MRLLLRGFHGDEALTLGLLDVSLPGSELHRFVSKSEMMKIEEILNPPTWTMVLENKAIFYKYCSSLGLPIPELYALWFKNYVGYSREGLILRNRVDWEHFLKCLLPEEFVLKSAMGAYGSGVMLFQRSGQDRFIDLGSDKTCTTVDILDIMMPRSQLVIQERLTSHPDLVRLSGSKNLQTLRIWTYLDSDGECKILYAFLKPIVGKNVVDNRRHGLTGNLVAEVDLGTGALKTAAKIVPHASALVSVSTHPETGRPFKGFAVPMWDEACRTAKQAALKFMPLRLVGWDIAVTSDGPRLIEGNWNGDPPSWNGNMDAMLAPVRDDLLRAHSEGWYSSTFLKRMSFFGGGNHP
jgi:hypothetical protein